MSNTNETNELRKVRVEKLQKLQEMGRDPFKNERYDRTNMSADILNDFDAFDGKEVKVAGRIMAKREMGKAFFIDVMDAEGRIQSYVRNSEIGDEEFDIFKTYDIGDIVGLKGTVFKTKKEEISIRANEVILLTKSLQTLPEKYHGLKDTEIRYRQRYLDLIMNPEVKETFIKRNTIVKAIREFLDSRGYMEVETPILATVASGAAAKPFETHHNALDIDMEMRIANELFLKRLIVGGFDKVYEMGKMFRNEGVSIKHNPEYTAMELYAAYEDYTDMMKITEELVEYCAIKVHGTTVVDFHGTKIDFKTPWRRVSMHDLVEEKTGVDFYGFETVEEARKAAKELHLDVEDYMTKGHFVNLAFEDYCEGDLIQPTFIMHHPVEISPLSKRNPENPEITNRFEAFANGWEIANAFSELNDPIDQLGRFEDQARQREGGDDEAMNIDEDFMNALEVGLPPTGGLGIGIDRMIMLITQSQSIRDIIFFPTMKPQK